MAALRNVKLANSIKVGPREESFLTDTYFDLDLTDNALSVTCKKSGQSCSTSIYNIIYWNAAEEKTVAPRKIVKNVSK